MELALLVATLAVASPSVAPAPAPPRTLRLEVVHAGNAGEEHFARERVVREGPWPGNPARPVDDTNLGRYLFEVRDLATHRVVYSRGFASIYGEWETTDEANETWRAFHESLRFPEPASAVQVAIRKRDASGGFRELWTDVVDPKAPAIDGSEPKGKAWAVVENGPPAEKVDLVLLGDGYTAGEMDKWHRDARRLADILFSVSPFKERRSDFNVWAVDTPSDESGVARPSDGVYRRSALRASYDAFGSERYVLAFDDRRVREAAAAAPYDVMEIVVNGRKYGGGGIFNLYATVASDNAYTAYVFVHEFGHHFAGLADEYYTSDVAYGAAGAERPEPWEPNATASAVSPKWQDLVTAGTPLPTSWSKAEFEAMQKDVQARRRKIRAEKRPEEEMEALFREEQQRADALLGQGPHAHAVGAFEGALYEASGYYRSEANCLMFTRHTSFCAACRRGIERVIDLHTRR
jgi:hypothetical protein